MKALVFLLSCFVLLEVVHAVSIDRYDNGYNYERKRSKKKKHKHSYYDHYYSSSEEYAPQRPPNPGYETITVCPDGWTEFQRIKGKWCIRVFPPNMKAAEAENACKAVGATLTGLENDNERIFIRDQAIQYIGANDYGRTIVGGVRRAICYNVNNPECIPKQTRSFEWTDGFTTGVDGFKWQTNPNQPDNFQNVQNYVSILAVTGSWLNHYTFVGQVVGPLDDIEGTGGGSYACGRQPETRRVPKS